MLYNFRKCESKSSQKFQICTIKFCVETWPKMFQKTNDQLTGNAQNLFHLLEQAHCMNILLLENQVKDLISPNCGQFQLYFYKN